MFFLFVASEANAVSLLGRMGVGMTKQLKGDLTGLSLKVQQTRESALGVIAAVSADEDVTDYAFGGKYYQILFDEPHLNFYGAGMLAMLKTNDKSGYQVDATLGSVFHIPGIESLGFSFEFGVSLNKVDGIRSIETTGYNFFNAAIHFYL